MIFKCMLIESTPLHISKITGQEPSLVGIPALLYEENWGSNPPPCYCKYQIIYIYIYRRTH